MSAETSRAWTAERIRGLGATTDVVTAGSILGIGRTTAHDLARRGQFPVPVLRIGRRYRVPVAPILRLLALDPAEPAPPEPATASTPSHGGLDRSHGPPTVALGPPNPRT